jgi:hypothetical protein
MQQTTSIIRKCRKSIFKYQSRLRCSLRTLKETCLGSCVIFFNDDEMVQTHPTKEGLLAFNEDCANIFIATKYLEVQSKQNHTCLGYYSLK